MKDESEINYHNEIVEITDQLEIALLKLEQIYKNENQTELVHSIFRYAHNLKSALSAVKKKFFIKTNSLY